MTFPQEKEVYIYDNKKYIVVSIILFSDVFVQDYLEENDKDCSHIQTLNWWMFMLKATHIGSAKMSKSY